jgi:hypothetical protein
LKTDFGSVYGGGMGIDGVIEQVERLNRVSARRVVDPDEALPGGVGDGQLLPDELLSTHGLDLGLTAEQRRVLAREELASIYDAGIRFEAVLEVGFALQVAGAKPLTDPRVTYLLHEMGEETRHQRLFQRVLTQLDAQARNPLDRPILARVERLGTGWITRHRPMLYVMVLAGEEIPDLLQKLAAEHPATDPFVAAVSRYHRQEEARHLSFARAVLPEVWAEASALERAVVRHVAPKVIGQMFSLLVHPGVYAEVGLDPWPTWRAANATPERRQLRHLATRPVLDAVRRAGAFPGDRVPQAWRDLCGVDAAGAPAA